MADIKWDAGWGFDYYSPSGDINQALATRDASGTIELTDYAKQNLSTAELIGLMKDLGIVGPVQKPKTEKTEDKPHLSDLGQAIQDALDSIGRGGDKSKIVAGIQARAMTAAQSGKMDIAAQLTAIASEYANSADFANQSDRGIGYLMGLQADLTAGNYTIGGGTKGSGGTVAVPPGYTPPAGQYQGWGFTYDSPTGDVNDASNLYPNLPPPPPAPKTGVYNPDLPWLQGWGFEYQSPTGDINDASAARWTAEDELVRQNWPQLWALKVTLEKLDGATVTVVTTPAPDPAEFLTTRG